MITFDVHTQESAPAGAKDSLAMAQQKYGFVPNLLRELAAAPQALEGYLALNKLLATTSLTPQEQQVVLAATSVANNCAYCVAAHTGGLKMAGVPDDEIQALRQSRPMSDPRLESVRAFTVAVVEGRGWIGDAVLRQFLEAGHLKEQVLEVLVGVAAKTLSNYTNHIANTPLDPQFEAFAWESAKT